MKPILLFRFCDELAEGPFFDRNKLWWVSILEGRLHVLSLESNEHESWHVGGFLGFALPYKGNDMKWLLGCKDRLKLLDLDSGETELFVNFPNIPEEMRFNDGKYDPVGRFWFGNLSLEGNSGKAELFMMDEYGSVRLMRSNLSLSNGLAWNEDASVMYHVDSMEGILYRYELGEDGVILTIKVFIKFEKSQGSPDGMCIDKNGFIYLAMWGGSCVLVIDSSDGSVVNIIGMPVSQPSSCCLNNDETVLFITSAWQGLGDEQRVKEPLAGSVFKVNLK